MIHILFLFPADQHYSDLELQRIISTFSNWTICRILLTLFVSPMHPTSNLYGVCLLMWIKIFRCKLSSLAILFTDTSPFLSFLIKTRGIIYYMHCWQFKYTDPYFRYFLKGLWRYHVLPYTWAELFHQFFHYLAWFKPLCPIMLLMINKNNDVIVKLELVKSFICWLFS